MLATRRAYLRDVDGIVFELNKHITSCNNYYPAAEKNAVAMTVHSSFHHTSPALSLLCVEGEKIAGMACVVASRYLWADMMQAQIIIAYVAPEYRHGRAFSMMMNDIEEWCREKKCDQISFEIASGINDEATVAMMQRRGWEKTGIGLVKRL